MSRSDKRSIRCAIYTRKSSEEGLEQSFNSLDAQREACEAYALSQRHEGWRALRTNYDDGGFSGGTMDRPGLKRLLEDIAHGKIDTVIVYKVDRLTRSLADFAKIIEAFDSRGVSFVSVTQQFNTTTSMGRLTLNVLLSFAQFEREVMGERIRDKVAASKKKGMWMGGNVPVGYDVRHRKLIVNPRWAKVVREIFEQYVWLGCVSKLKAYLEQQNVKSPVRISVSGRKRGGHVFSRGALYKILNNQLYLGEIHHRGHIYSGQHQAIIDRELWQTVAEKLKANNQAHRERRTASGSKSLLEGLLFDTAGFRYTPTHATKAGKRYRYYTSQAAIRHAPGATGIPRIPGHDVEKVVRERISALLAAPDAVLARARKGPKLEALRHIARQRANTWATTPIGEQNEFVRKIIDRVVMGHTILQITVKRQAFIHELIRDGCGARSRGPATQDTVELTCPMQVHRTAGVSRVVVPSQVKEGEGAPSYSVIKALARARHWYERFASGEVQTLRALASQTGVTQRYISRILKCAVLGPPIVEAMVDGYDGAAITLDRLTKDVPLAWSAQVEFVKKVRGVAQGQS